MTHAERNRRVMALDILVLAANDPRAEEKIAELLAGWFRDEAERYGKCCLNVAREWRHGADDVYGKTTISDEGVRLRERSAESAELCASRIAPWLRTEKESEEHGKR